MTQALATAEATERERMIAALKALMDEYERACRYMGYDPRGSKGYDMAAEIVKEAEAQCT